MTTLYNKKVCLASVTDESYFHASVTMIYSFSEQNPWFDGEFILFVDRYFLGESFSFSDITITFRKVNDRLIDNIKSVWHISSKIKDNYRQLFSIEAFSLQDYDQVIFADSDMIFTGSIHEILKYENDLVACNDSTFYRSNALCRDRDTYREVDATKSGCIKNTINAGLVGIPKNYLNNEIYNDLVTMTGSPDTWNTVEEFLTDEIILNHYFESKFSIIKSDYNFRTHIKHRILKKEILKEDQIKVLHFAGTEKPWEYIQFIKRLNSDYKYISYFNSWYDVYEKVHDALPDEYKLNLWYRNNLKIKILKIWSYINPYTHVRYIGRYILWDIIPRLKFL